MTRSEFLKTKEMKKIRANIFACAALGYAIAVGSVIVNVIHSRNFSVILDAVFLIAMSLLIHLLQSRVAAILIGVYSVINIGVMYYMNGKPGGIIVLAVAIYAIIYTFKFQKAWHDHKNSNGNS
jgi:hypothetical protein